MEIKPRRRRQSNIPVEGRETLIPEEDLRDLDYRTFELLEPSLGFQFLTNPWLHYFTGGNLNRRTKRCGHLRENKYIDVPEMWFASPNTPYKHFAYELKPRAARANKARGVPTLAAHHRSNSYYHEVIVDMGFNAPLRYAVANDPQLRLITAADLLKHQNVPQSTREHSDPFAVSLSGKRKRRFDGTPLVLIRNEKPLCIPGIEVDRNTEGNTSEDAARTTLGSHISEIHEFMRSKLYATHYGFTNSVVPVLIVDRRYDREGRTENRMRKFMAWVQKEFGPCPYLLFKTLPDIAMLDHFPKPSADFVATPFKRVGYPDYNLLTLGA